jgi:hypothetical protein
MQELEQFVKGFGPQAPQKALPAPSLPQQSAQQPKPYKPKVKGQENLIKQYFGE